MSPTKVVEMSDNSPATSPEPEQKKRKRSKIPIEDEIEIDINQPEPPSKKAKRKEKKLKLKGVQDGTATDGEAIDKPAGSKEETTDASKSKVAATDKRSEYGIWIGNLPWSATKDSLRTFLTEKGDIDDSSITRLHMPAPEDKGPKKEGFKTPQNKGFAYVDFSTAADLDKAIALSEKLLVGRRVLIKNAKSFEGRPKVTKEESDLKKVSTKEPTKRVFVGNLSFDVTQEDLTEHFAQAGEVEDVHMATFQDSGKCKGFAWVRYTDVDAASAAVRGFIFKDMRDEADQDDDEDDAAESGEEGEKPAGSKKRKEKKRKWFINRLHGRPLRCEFAEDAQTRYKKRFGKDAKRGDATDSVELEGGRAQETSAPTPDWKNKKLSKDERQDARRKRHEDARSVAPGMALANAQRATGAIVAPAGKKTTFD